MKTNDQTNARKGMQRLFNQWLAERVYELPTDAFGTDADGTSFFYTTKALLCNIIVSMNYSGTVNKSKMMCVIEDSGLYATVLQHMDSLGWITLQKTGAVKVHIEYFIRMIDMEANMPAMIAHHDALIAEHDSQLAQRHSRLSRLTLTMTDKKFLQSCGIKE